MAQKSSIEWTEWDRQTGLAAGTSRRPGSPVALMLVKDVAMSDLQHQNLPLRSEDHERNAEVIEGRFTALARELGTGERLRRRLREFTGITLTWTWEVSTPLLGIR